MNEKKKVFVRTGKMLLSAMLSLTAAAGTVSIQPILAEESEFTASSDDQNGTAQAFAQTDLESSKSESVSPSDFTNVGAAGMTIEGENLILEADGDHFAMLNTQKTAANDFHLEANVSLLEGTGQGNEGDQMSAALVFGASSKKTPGTKWYAANVDTRRKENNDFFRVFGAGKEILPGGIVSDIDTGKPIHLAVDVKADGSFTFEFGNTGNTLHSVSGKIENWEGGYVGLLTFCAKASFTSISFTDRTKPQENQTLEPAENWSTNLGTSVIKGGIWSITEQGLVSDATNQGDTFLIGQESQKNFVYETDMKFEGDSGAAGLIFRFDDGGEYGKEGYAVNVDAVSHKAKFWRWQNNDALQLIDEVEVAADSGGNYHLQVVCIDGSIQYRVNGKLVANLSDHTMQKNDLGQNSYIKEGKCGLLNWNAKAVFQNTKITELNAENTPAVSDVTVTSSTGTVDKKAQFFPDSATWIQYVNYNASSVIIDPALENGSTVTFEKDGQVYQAGADIPVAVGINWITMTVSNNGISRTYQLDIHRFDQDSLYYNEPWRDQYHYSVKEGWANDPNGLVYYKGKYHMFYQFYDDTKWGPMHWMHATSTDLVHWEEQPMALYPDENGTMFSGCIAVDDNNASGLFPDSKGGLIAYITVNGNGQRIKLATSEDEGKTWKKQDDIALDWSNDPLQNRDFRDPKVFKWENKWFMVLAGGPLRIYSSDNMKDWTVESVYSDLHTECPDLYPQQVDGQIKWILSRGGRYYKVGDLKEVNGKWSFVPDDAYQDNNGIMNFGPDSYAAMTYYIQDFGTAQNPKIPDLIELNWMNTWDDYCNLVADKLGQKFNGTFNLNLQIGLVNENGLYKLTQTPINAYQNLRQEAAVGYSGTLAADNTVLDSFSGSSYEIVSSFKPEAGTKTVGFKVRTGSNGEETAVLYDVASETLSIDRSKSGVQISSKFSQPASQHVTKNADGSIDLHLFVDAASVEVFASQYKAAGAMQIFATPTSLGAKAVVEGDACPAEIKVYPLASIWTNKSTPESSIQSTDALVQTLYPGKDKKLNVFVLPPAFSQNLTWTSSDETVATVDPDGTVHGLQPGIATITATTEDGKSLQFTFTIKEDNFNTNVKDWIMEGNWTIENDELIGSNTGSNDYILSKEIYEGDWTISTDVKYTKGLVNLFFASNTSPFDNQAYALQLSDGNSLKLFRFAGADIQSAQLDKPLNNGQYHAVKIQKEGKMVTVFVDGQSVLSHTLNETDAHFAKGHAGLGLWDGEASFKNFIVTAAKTPVQPDAVDLTALDTALKAAEDLNQADYTSESWTAFQNAVSAATAIRNNPQASQDEVNQAANTLNQAKASLKKVSKPVNPSNPDRPSRPSNPSRPSTGTSIQSKVVMHRLYNPNSGEHFYTGNTAEKNHLASLGWTYEGEGWTAPAKSDTPVYRLYNPNAGDHHYTTSRPEADYLVKAGWKDEGIGWYSDDSKGTVLYRLYNPNTRQAGAHHYTLDAAERDALVVLGWKDEGLAWHGLK